MTYALYCVNDATYGGVYYCADFTLTGAQPVWTKLTTTGLADLRCTHFQVDPDDPLNRQYVRTVDEKIYTRNGGDWTEILNKTICQTVTGVAGDNLYYLWADPTISGRVYAVYAKNGFPANDFIMKSVDYGTNWTSITLTDNENISDAVEAIGDNIFANGDFSITVAAQVYYTPDAGATFYQSKYGLGGSGTGYIKINPQDPAVNFASHAGANLHRFSYSGGVLTTVNTGNLDRLLFSSMYIPTDEGAGVMYRIYDETMYSTANNWTNESSVALGVIPTLENQLALTGETNQTGTVMAFGGDATGGMWIVDSGTDTTPTNRAGANYASAPYTDSLPNKAVAVYGIWFGMPPSSTGVHVFSVEEDDITDIYYHDGLGIPMFGDRSSWRDYDADDDGTDAATPLSYYHAEDIRDEQPQRHNPWPAASGTAPVSDGSKWVATDVVTQAEMHDPVTLDADAAAIMDLQGGGQEIGLDTQTANTVFAGPAAGAANEPTFRVLVVADLPSEVIIESEAHEHIINEDHTAECDGAETGFPTLLNFRSGSTQVYLNGIRQRLDTHYTEDGTLNGITFDTAPEAGDELIIDYIVTWSDYQAQAALLLDSDSVGLQDSDEENLADSTA